MAHTALADADKATGAFVRKDAVFRDWIRADASSKYPAAAGRYLLYVSYACPWANRCLAVRTIKGLEEVIEVAVVAPIWAETKPGVDAHRGWVFDPSYPGATADPIFGARTLREVYERAEGEGAATRFTVPVLFDKTTKRIVSNESSEIVRMFGAEFNAFAKHPEIDLYPAPLRAEIDAVNADVYDAINNGVYKAGFAQKQAAYLDACTKLFAALAKYDDLLATRRFLCGPSLTEADIRLVMTLLRFDEVYVVHFKCNVKPIRYHKHLFNYTCDVFQSAGLAASTNMLHIKEHYYLSHTLLNPYGLVPVGSPEYSDFSVPHGRDKLVAAAGATAGVAGGDGTAGAASSGVWFTAAATA